MGNHSEGGIVNSINSVLIEGEVESNPIIEAGKARACTFSIISTRIITSTAGMDAEISHFDIEARLPGMDRIEKGSTVRVFGRLKQDRRDDCDGNPASRVIVIADHIEVKPRMPQHDN